MTMSRSQWKHTDTPLYISSWSVTRLQKFSIALIWSSAELMRLVGSTRSSESVSNWGGAWYRSGKPLKKDIYLCSYSNDFQCPCAVHFTSHVEDLKPHSSLLHPIFCLLFNRKNRYWVSRSVIRSKPGSSQRPEKLATHFKLDTTVWLLLPWDIG